MALFNKLFSNRRSTHKNQDNVGEKFFAFSKDQVRLLLFRECDFRGRKLLFDSSSVKKVPVTCTKSGEVPNPDEKETFSEITNGYGYVYTKPQPDYGQLAEMVFGSVAMSFRGNYFKMHHLEAPNRLMFTQVFSSPRVTNRVSFSSRSLEHSKFDDSGASSTTSISEHSSVYSTASDTVLVCRRNQSSPLDVPSAASAPGSVPSLVGDSGCCVDGSTWSLSSNSLYKRWLRRTSASLEGSGQSLATSISACDGEGRHHRFGKLGLAFILQLTPGQEEELGQFLMEHVYLMEAMLWRARQVVELSFFKSHNFASLMVEMVQISAQYLVNLLSGSYLSVNLWLSLSSGCDNYNSISAFSDNLCESNSGGFFKDAESGGEFHLFNFTRFLKADPLNVKRSLLGESRITAEKFLHEFCELLENLDVKDTNFFMSTLLTAVLTYHLGWVNTCLPSAAESVLQSRHPFNPLWGELSDLYGAVGHPTKIAQTIITGSNRKELVSKILLSMTYFIRCCDVDRRVPIRADVNGDNEAVEKICRTRACIPKENYKKYEDHLKEILVTCSNNNNYCCKNNEETRLAAKKSQALVKTRTCLGDLARLDEAGNEDNFTNLTLCGVEAPTTKEDVVFVLGDNEQLVGLKNKPEASSSKPCRPSFLDLSNSIFHDDNFLENKEKSVVKLSSSYDDSHLEEIPKHPNNTTRCQSEPPEEHKPDDSKKQAKYRYSGVKFSLQQYPQILSSYMKRKNVEITNLQFGDKNMKLDELSSLSDTIISKYPELDEEYEEDDALQTPSNASELEFTSDLFVAPPSKPSSDTNCDNNCAKTERKYSSGVSHQMQAINLPMPKTKFYKPVMDPIKYTSSLMRAASDSYMPDMVLQGPVVPKRDWESKLKSDLALASQHSLIDQPVEEAVAVIANTDTWEVQLMSSHTFLIDKGSSGIRIGMSQLVSNMLESLLQMWKLKVPPHLCLMHIEQTLQELCTRSKALAELLLATEFCNMDQLTSTLQLEVNDVPLLLAVASTHSPQVTQKYGLSFQ